MELCENGFEFVLYCSEKLYDRVKLVCNMLM